MLQVKYGKKHIDFTDNWDELSKSQLNVILTLFWHKRNQLFEQKEEDFETVTYIKDDQLYHQTMISIIMCLAKQKRRFLHLSPDIVDELLHEIKPHKFLFDTPQFEANPIKNFPNSLNDLSISQFGFLDMFSKAFAAQENQNNISNLDMFCATLLVPHTEEIAFDKKKIEDYLKTAKRISLRKKQIVLFWFQAQVEQLAKQYKHVFSGNGDGKGPDWLKSILQMAHGGTFGRFLDTENCPANYFIAEMDRVMEEHNEAKRRLKNQTNEA